MRRVTAYRWGGQLYESEAAARRVIDEEVGKLLTRHAHTMVHLSKYSQILAHLEENLEDFHRAYLLTKDKEVTEDD